MKEEQKGPDGERDLLERARLLVGKLLSLLQLKGLAKDVVVIAAATAVSRVFGLFRDIVIADRFGASGAYDAYLIAFFVPHFLRRLLAEGALALSFIPVYTEYLKKDRREAAAMASNALNLLVLVFPLVIGLGVYLAPHFIPFLASGFPPERRQLAVSLTRVVFPFIGAVGLAALVMGVLNAKKHFFAPAFAPVFFNVGVICGALFLGRLFSRPIFGLAIGVPLGGLGQLFFQLPFLKRYGFRWEPRIFPLHPGLKKALRMMGPVVVGLVAAQINVLVDNKLASHLHPGSISSLQYAMRLFQLPLGLFSVAISTAILPRLSERQAEGRAKEFSEVLRDGLELSLFILLPAAVGLFLLGRPIVELLFEHNNFTGGDTLRTVSVLNLYLIGLLGYSLVQLLTRGFYSLQDTLTPVLVSLLAVGVNVGLDLALIGPLGVRGLALATATAGLVNGGALLVAFRYRFRAGGFLPALPLAARILLGVSGMGGMVFFSHKLAETLPLPAEEFLTLLIPLSVGVGSYFALSHLLGMDDLIWKVRDLGD